MSDPNDPTADYRKYAKPPNFLGIVIASAVVIIMLLVAANLLLGWDARKLLPHRPNPHPNALVWPLLSPGDSLGRA